MASSSTETTLPEKLFAGAVAGIIGTCCIFPLDMAKTRLMNQIAGPDGTVRYRGLLHCISKIVRDEGGPRALYKGISANLIGVTPEKAIKLAANDFLREKLIKDPINPNLLLEMVAGGGAGFVQVIATNPMEITKIRMQLSALEAAKTNTKPQSLLSIIKELGFTGMYQGTPATLLRDIPFSVLYFTMYSRGKAILANEDGVTTFPKVMFSACFSGALAAGLTTPLDVIKTRLQVKQEGKRAYTGIFDAAIKIYKIEGPAAFWKGTVPRMCILSPLFGIAVSVYELQKLILHNQKS